MNVPVFVTGDLAYPMLPWLVKPCNQPSIDSAEKRTYNYRIYCVEIAFSRLKAHWRQLLKRNDMIVKNITNVVAAACVLHNMREIHGESFDESWVSDDGFDDLSRPDRHPYSTAHSGSVAIREALVLFLYFFYGEPHNQ